jgi:phosphoenolpyruvate synthase/pyruvate phosphate dikinase
VLIVWFGDPASTEHQLVGGKGANLGRLTQAGFDVPAGFTVTAAAYQEFMRSAGLADRISELLAGVAGDDAQALESATAAIRELITGSEFPETVAGAIRQRQRLVRCSPGPAPAGDACKVARGSSGRSRTSAGSRTARSW